MPFQQQSRRMEFSSLSGYKLPHFVKSAALRTLAWTKLPDFPDRPA
jgi:hypothetical protein